VTDAARYRHELAEAFELARGEAERVEHAVLRIAGKAVRLVFVGRRIAARLGPALAHLKVSEDDRPDLTICLWDGGAVGRPAPLPAWFTDESIVNDIWRYRDPQIRMLIQRVPDLSSLSLSLYDKAEKWAMFWVGDAESLPAYETGAPLRSIFQWSLGEYGIQLVHAAAVGTEAGGALLVGRGGSGKSTVAMKSLDAGMLYVSDDYSLVGGEDLTTVYSLYCTGKVYTEDLAHYTTLGEPDLSWDEKSIFFLNRSHPRSVVASLALKAIVVPRIVAGQVNTQLVSTSKASALLALAPSTVFQLSGSTSEDLSRMRRVVSTLPCYSLELGSDRSQVPHTIRELLDKEQGP